MVCDDCKAAEAWALHPKYWSQCLGCQARMIAHGKDRFDAIQAGAITPQYRDTLRAAFGDAWKEGAAMVKAWADKIEAAMKEDKKA